MRRLTGFALFCAAMGMLVMMLIPSSASLLRAAIFFICLIAGYFLSCK